MKQYTLHLMPRDGVTLAKQTRTEFALGYMFKVLASDILSIHRGSFVTFDEIATLENSYDISFNITFETQTVRSHITKLAKTDYAVAQAAKLDWGIDNG